MSENRKHPNDGADYEDTVSSHTTGDGPKAPHRDKSPEHQYPADQRATGVNRTDAQAPGGPVNIPVKGKPDGGGADAAGRKPGKTEPAPNGSR